MRKVSVFHFVTLNGFYKGVGEDISWHRHGGEESKYSEDGLASGNILLFGRVTYEMMSSFWPTPEAIKSMPVVAKGMNAAEKIVFSRTLKKAAWNHTKLIKDDMIGEIRKMKQTPGPNMTVLGSGSVAMQLAEAGLIDEYQVMIDPVIIGEGGSLFKGVGHTINLVLTKSKVFKSGMILLCYEPDKG